jgi:D-glycero-alpha-D-manno-heptose-7-phosphate kinase
MIITKTPFRISFLGGGTDYPEYFERNGGGAVLGTTINHSAFVSVTRLYSELFSYNLRIAYREVECVNSLDEIQHAAFRECLRRLGVTRNVEVNYTSHLPSFCGIGSSSSCIVGLLNALHAFQGRTRTPIELAYEAIDIERNVLCECVGCQDQVMAAVGGFNLLEFRSRTDIRVHPVTVSPQRLASLEQYLMMFFTGYRRRASEVAAPQVGKIAENGHTLLRMLKLVDEGYHCLSGTGTLDDFGRLLDANWQLKQSLHANVANSEISRQYETGMQAGALGGKLLGAGGGGFLLLFVPPERQENVRKHLQHLTHVPVSLSTRGSHVVHRPE